MLCIAFKQGGYEWPVRQEGPCIEQEYGSIDQQHFLECVLHSNRVDMNGLLVKKVHVLDKNIVRLIDYIFGIVDSK